MVSPASHGIPRVPRYSRTPAEVAHSFDYGSLTLSGGPFQGPSPRVAICNFLRAQQRSPPHLTTPAVRRRLVWAFPRSLAATRRIISFPRGTKMFQFPRLPLPDLCVQSGVLRHDSEWVPPFGYLRLSLLDNKPKLIAVLPRPSSAHDAKASSARP